MSPGHRLGAERGVLLHRGWHARQRQFPGLSDATPVDVPMIETVILEVPNPRHPFGLRGVGEAPIIPPLAAIANAIYQAVGVRMDRLPMSPGAILEALQRKQASTQTPGQGGEGRPTRSAISPGVSAVLG